MLEKDIWVVWTLQALFEDPVGDHLVFKGGTSLSKAYQAIDRFSEDVDLTYDIREIASDIIRKDSDPIPPSKSQASKWSKIIRERLPVWIDETILPLIGSRLEAQGLAASISREGDTAHIAYDPLTEGTGYVRPVVLLEFGARSTGEPADKIAIGCDAAPQLPELEFPAAQPRVMRAERTFWEKATAIHVYCLKGEFRGGERFARHWYDLIALNKSGIADRAINDPLIAKAVAQHKTRFFLEKDMSGTVIDYERAISGGLKLVPNEAALKTLQDDYERMVEDGLLMEEPQSFDDLMRNCASLEQRANDIARS